MTTLMSSITTQFFELVDQQWIQKFYDEQEDTSSQTSGVEDQIALLTLFQVHDADVHSDELRLNTDIGANFFLEATKTTHCSLLQANHNMEICNDFFGAVDFDNFESLEDCTMPTLTRQDDMNQ